MLKLFANQRKISAMLLRTCSPAVVSSSLRNTHNLKDCRRSMSTGHDVVPLPNGDYYAWSLTSDKGHSLMKLKDNDGSGRKMVECSGTYNEQSRATVMEVVDRSTATIVRVALGFTSSSGTQYYLSAGGKEDIVEAMTYEDANLTGYEQRFIHWKHGSYSMFECHLLSRQFLGCSPVDGSLVLVHVGSKFHPDPRVLFLLNVQGSN